MDNRTMMRCIMHAVCRSAATRMRLYLIFLSFLSNGSQATRIVIEPQNPIVLKGQNVTLTCKVDISSIRSCWWLSPYNNQLVNHSFLKQSGKCEIELNPTHNDSGLWTCFVWTDFTKKQSAVTRLTVLDNPVLSFLSIFPNESYITAIAGNPKELKCVLNQSINKHQSIINPDQFAIITWKIGEREIDSSFHSAKLQELDGQYSLIDTLHYAFYPNENMQDIICQIAGNWVYQQTDERRNCAVSKQLRVTSQQPTTIYGFIVNQEGKITINFIANSYPVFVAWKLDDDTELSVVPYGKNIHVNKYKISRLKNVTYNSYEACLTIDPILISDSRRIFSLTVRTQASNIEINYLSNSSTGASISSEGYIEQEYIRRISFMAGGYDTLFVIKIVGIIVGIILLFFIIWIVYCSIRLYC